MNHNELRIEVVNGSLAPRYDAKTKSLRVTAAVVTEHGMQSGMPLVDIQMEDQEKNKYWFALTGVLLITLADVVKEGMAPGESDPKAVKH